MARDIIAPVRGLLRVAPPHRRQKTRQRRGLKRRLFIPPPVRGFRTNIALRARIEPNGRYRATAEAYCPTGNSRSQEPVLSDSEIGRQKPVLSDSEIGRQEPVLSDSEIGRQKPVLSDSEIGRQEPVLSDSEIGR